MPLKRRPPLAPEFVRSILDYDPETGILRWRYRADHPRKWNSRYAGTVAGSKVKGYLQIQIPKPCNYYAHQLAWAHAYGTWPEHLLDHINGIRDDNRISNLRPASYSKNGGNKVMQKNNRSGFVGVWFNAQRGKWEASISRDGKRWRRFFDSKYEAAEARRIALLEIHGEFAKIS